MNPLYFYTKTYPPILGEIKENTIVKNSDHSTNLPKYIIYNNFVTNSWCEEAFILFY